MTATERFLKYVSFSTQSEDDVEEVPSTKHQWDLARYLENELKEMGLSDVTLSDHAYVTGMLPATKGYESVPAIGFISHMDTATEVSGDHVHPQVIEHYDGRDVALGDSGLVLDTKTYPHLPSLAGQTLITTDGTTLLGADDKAGIAEIMTMAETLIRDQIPHGKICIGFTPDEEVGHGPSYFDIEHFGADYAYTVDGGEPEWVTYENFNACAARFDIKGYSVHPGMAKDLMVNALLVGCEINSMLPAGDTPSHTEGYEGFYHLTGMSGSVSSCTMNYIIRDFDAGSFAARKETLTHIAKVLNEKYGEGTVTLSIRDQYPNMAESLKDKMYVVDNVFDAISALGMKPEALAGRGGTDGATLSAEGLPCPNIGTGGYAAHGPYEHITSERLDLCTDLLLEIINQSTKSDRA